MNKRTYSNLFKKVGIPLLIVLSNICSAQSKVDLRSLLQEMISYDAMAKWPEPAYIEKQASSYDRNSTSPDQPGWFGNADASQYIRTETVGGRKENVMMDADGPGAIVRFWLTTFKRHGVLRIYLDNHVEPEIIIPSYDLLKSGLLAGPALLSPHSSYEPTEKGGSTLYLPIPFAKHCKITWEDQDNDHQPRYYQINYRQYVKGSTVTSFTIAQMAGLTSIIKMVNLKLLHPDTISSGYMVKAMPRLAAHDSAIIKLPGGTHAINFIKFKLQPGSIDRLLIRMRFDGKQTVYCPLADFAGSGVGGNPIQSWYRTVTKDGNIFIRWVMPYKQNASITLINNAGPTISSSIAIATKNWQWNSKSLYFHASWHHEDSIPVRTNEKENPIEWELLDAKGRGVFLGDTYAVDNKTHGWYGEGDQKFWVDTDSFPSEYGTGTEDYYNTSWAPVKLYQTPFANAPRADNADSYGRNTFTRTRNLDRIPFDHHLRYSIEMLGWQKGVINASTVTYWYGSPGAVSTSNPKDQYLGFQWHGRKSLPEIVSGASGYAVRTDGYSSYLSLKESAPLPPKLQLSAYFALETYPADTAGFMTIYSSQKAWIAASIDKYGNGLICVFEDGKYHWTPLNKKLEKFKWMHLALSIKGSSAILYLNGKMTSSVKIDPQCFLSIDSLELGKDGRRRKIGVFPINYFNGIIDQPQLTNDPGKMPDFTEIARITRMVPHLAIPPSRFAGDFTRPTYHLLPAANWTNETHGLIYYKGLYHIFNQKNGTGLFLGQINWGHYTSPDLIHWTEQKPVLTPEPGYDQSGIWSGSVVLDVKGVPNIFYSSSGPDSFNVCRALPSNKSLMNWIKPSGNPVISASPAQYSRKDFHDPYVWKEGERYYMIVGFGLTDEGHERGAVLLYRSDDLKTWTYLHPLYSGNPSVDDSGVFWEMPVFYKLNHKYILLVNKTPHKGIPARALYWTGDFKEEKFIPDDPKPKTLEVINRLLSPSVSKDANGNTVAIAIIPDETSSRATYNVGWTHLYSIPRIWTLKDGKICQQPYPALSSLREDTTELTSKNLASGDTLLLASGQQLELSVDVMPDSIGKFGFIVGRNPSGSEYSKIFYDFKKQQLIVDQTKSSTRKYIPLNIRTGDYLLEGRKKVNFHFFFDGSVIEGFINGEDAFTTRIFPTSSRSDQIELFTEGGSLKLIGGNAWKLKDSPVKTNF